MNTPTHIALAVNLFGNSKRPKQTKWIIWGALMPDLPMFLLLGFDLARQIPMQEIWDSRYFQDYWQTPLNFTNSIFIYLFILLIAYWRKSPNFMLFAAAALLHILCDLPFHREDGHAHFWPLTDWKFISPVSYWDPNHFGRIFSTIEMLFLTILAFTGLRIFQHLWAKILYFAFTIFMPLAMAGYWIYAQLAL